MQTVHGCPVPPKGTLRRLLPLLAALLALGALVAVSVPCFQDNLQSSTRHGGWLWPLPRPARFAPSPPEPGALTPTSADPLSTFAVDVDTAALDQLRGAVARGTLPPPGWIRSEEVVNGLDYGWPSPEAGADVAVHVAGAPSPWTPDRHLLTVALRVRDLSGPRPPLRLTLLLDRSGSMAEGPKLHLTRAAVTCLLGELSADDQVAVVAYGDAAEVLLGPTRAGERERVEAAVARAEPRGSTNLSAGLETAYDLALTRASAPGLDRVILFTDGLANAGVTDTSGQLALIRRAVDAGVDLLAVGVGMGEYGDPTLEKLADQGNGIYVYLNDDAAVRRVFHERLTAHLVTLARDMRVQVAFDPAAVTAWRQVGYHDRRMRPEGFRDDGRDAGEVGPGHAVTAVYEVAVAPGPGTAPLGRVAVRWRGAADGAVSELSRALPRSALSASWADAPRDLRLAANAALFAEELALSLAAGRASRLDQLAADAARLGAAPDATASCRAWAELAGHATALASIR